MNLGNLVNDAVRRIEAAGAGVSGALFEPVLRLGVTGLARSGKTVFITSLIANLIARGRMVQLHAATEGRIRAAFLQPQPDDTVARFDYEEHLAALTGAAAHWPPSTCAISELRLSLKVQPAGLLGALKGPRTVHLDIVDYPGEWLLDLTLLGQSFADWSAAVLARAAPRAEARDFLAMLKSVEASGAFAEPAAQVLAASYTDYLRAIRARGLADCTPGRFLLPGDLAGSPVLTFVPLTRPQRPARRSFWREMERRYEAYKHAVARPFFRDHFARIDRQVVLVDALGAIRAGPEALDDLRQSMATLLRAFRPGRNSWLAPVLGRRVEKILFAATKADYLHHAQHARLSAIMAALVAEARTRADFAGADTQAMAIAALRTTVEEVIAHDGATLECVRGRLANGKQAALFAGELPADPAELLAPARRGAAKWLDVEYDIMDFEPARGSLRPGEGPPHIRLDRAAEFLLGDRLR